MQTIDHSEEIELITSMDIHYSSILNQISQKATLITRGSLPAPWKTFFGANGELTPFGFTTTQNIGNRIVQNSRIYGYNYASIALVIGIFRVLLSPSLLFLSGLVILGWFAYHSRYYEKFQIPEVIFFRGIAFCSFVVLCLVGPAALSWGFGFGGSIAIAHACFRNSISHKDDDCENVDDEEVGLKGEGNRSSSTTSLSSQNDDLYKDTPFVSCDDHECDLDSLPLDEAVGIVWDRLKKWVLADGGRALSAFRYMDQDGSGTLDITEFKNALQDTGILDGVSEKILQQIIVSADSNFDGVVQYSEFVSKLKH